MAQILVPRRWQRQPQWPVRVRDEWSDCLVYLGSQHGRVPTRYGTALKEQVFLAQAPITFGVKGTSYVIAETYVGGTPLWNADTILYSDAFDGTNYRGLSIGSATAYGRAGPVAYNISGTKIAPIYDVTPYGNVTSRSILVRGCSIDSGGYATAYGDGAERNSGDSSFRNHSFDIPSTGRPFISGANGGNDTATRILWLVRAPRFLTLEDNARLYADPYNVLFEPERIFVPMAGLMPSAPTLSLPGVQSITSTSAVPKVTLTFS